MSIKKNTPNYLKKVNQPFTTILNETIELIRDPGALGIYCLLASKPAGWEILEKFLINHFSKGRDYVRNKMKYLKSLGLLSVVSLRNKSGQITSWETTLYNHITENPTYGIKLIKNKPKNINQITENSTCRKNQNLAKPQHINKRSTLEIKELITTTTTDLPSATRKGGNVLYTDQPFEEAFQNYEEQNPVVVVKDSETTQTLLHLFRANPKNHEKFKDEDEFLRACNFSIENREKIYSVDQRLRGIKKLLKGNGFEKPERFEIIIEIKNERDLSKYRAYTSQHLNDIALGIKKEGRMLTEEEFFKDKVGC